MQKFEKFEPPDLISNLSEKFEALDLISNLSEKFEALDLISNLLEKSETPDLISNLPDEVLCSIISLLPTKQAIATSLYSKRWKFLWKSLSRLSFDVTFVDYGYNYIVNDGLRIKHTEKMSIVDKFLSSHIGNVAFFHLDHFRRDWTLSDYMIRWIEFLKNEKGLEGISLSCNDSRRDMDVPQSIFNGNFLQVVELNGYILSDASPFKGCVNVKTLKITACVVSKETLIDILDNCEFLENLSLGACSEWLLATRTLSIRHKKLKLLEIHHMRVKKIFLISKTLIKLVLDNVSYDSKSSVIHCPNLRIFNKTNCLFKSQMDKKLIVIAAVEVIATNADILSEILFRLPANSLVRFSAVCKLWYSIIISMHFRVRHSRCLAFSNALPPSGIYFYNCLSNSQDLESLSLTDDNVSSLPPVQVLHGELITTTFKVTQSCNGLLMCILTERSNTHTSRKGLVYNPVNKFRHVLPTLTKSGDHLVYYNLISDSKPPYYKALCVTYERSLNLDQSMSLYMLESRDSWRHCGRMSATGKGFDNGVFWNGAIHWIGEYYSVYFVVNSEEVGRIEMPPMPRGPCNQKIRYFGEWGGHLHLIRVQSIYAKKFNVLELDKDTLKWSLKYRVHLARLILAFPEMVQQTSSGTQYAFSILSVIRGEMEEDSVLLLAIPGKVVAYNLVLKTAKVIRELPGEVCDALRFNHLSAYQYTESFAPGEDWTIDPK